MIKKVKRCIEDIKNSIENELTDLGLYIYINYEEPIDGLYANHIEYSLSEEDLSKAIKEYEGYVLDDNIIFTALGLKYIDISKSKLPCGRDILQHNK